ncbi:hypothetical protein GCM10009798_17200 [Nocardioides panacihumi]|uniref:Uncharacterized protein n=1 Tax=Nocardioides panacihumi TaxID=400774 RepID=A0ABN2QUG8_9ACTN
MPSAASATAAPVTVQGGNVPAVRRPPTARLDWLDATAPSHWCARTEPRDWFEPSDPSDIDDPIEPADANDPTLPTDANDPTLPTDSTEPRDHSERTESVEPIDQPAMRPRSQIPAASAARRTLSGS